MMTNLINKELLMYSEMMSAERNFDDSAFDANLTLRLAWAAGLCDGEGCISISKQHQPGRKNATYRLRLDMVQNNLETLEEFRATMATCDAHGGLYKVKRTVRHNRQVYTLVYDGNHAARAIGAVRPYLVRKRLEADVALEYVRVAQVSRLPGSMGFSAEVWTQREAFRQKLQRLK